MSSLEDLYREVILDHYRAPRNQGELASPPAIASEGKNPACGDELTLYIDVQDDVIQDVKIAGSGCSISQASASMMTEAVKGKSVSNANDLIAKFKEMMDIHETKLGEGETSGPAIELGDLSALTGVVKFPVRIKCATLAFNTLKNALEMAKGVEKGVATSE